jgi:hypothetical protein
MPSTRSILGLMLISLLSARLFAQGKKTLLVDMPLSADPVRVVRVMEGTTELKSDGQKYPNRFAWEAMFSAGDDWLKGLSFLIKNASEKKIVYLAAGCHLHESDDWQAEFARHQSADTPLVGQISNRVGRRPEQALYSPLLGRRLKPDTDTARFELSPGQEFTMALESADDYPALVSWIESKEPISSVTACNGGITQIFFDDGTQWQGHRYLRADPDQPGHWSRISFEEWSGRKKGPE